LKETWVRPGHFYSPIPNVAELTPRAEVLFGPSSVRLPDVDVNEKRQLEVVEALVPLHEDRIYREADAFVANRYRYHPRNDTFGLASAACLHLMMRHLKSKRVIEVGSGFSSAVMLDTADFLARDPIDFTFIEPFPDRLHGLLKPGDREHVRILVSRLQEVDASLFSRLESGDLLFVDSSHVLKTDSDVNRILFDILPRLVPGVFVHFHDVLYPFEYPWAWVEEERAWNECYALRAFLAYNKSFEIYFWASYLFQHHREALSQLPAIDANGSSIWVRRVC
jgi:predicted O-methyltransferase YrrM